MKTIYVFWLSILLLLLTNGCKKDTVDDSIIIELDGKTYKSLTVDDFESLSDTADWNIYPGGRFEFDSVNPFEGRNSIHLLPLTTCFELEKTEGVPVDPSKIYVVNFHYKMQPANTGFCVLFYMIIEQGNEYLATKTMRGTEGWFEKNVYFQPLNGIPVKIRIYVGNYTGVWLDNLIVFEEY